MSSHKHVKLIRHTVMPGSTTGVYFIPVANLAPGMTFNDLRLLAQEVGHAEKCFIYPHSGVGWVRVRGAKQFDNICNHLNGREYQGHSIQAFRENENAAVYIWDQRRTSKSSVYCPQAARLQQSQKTHKKKEGEGNPGDHQDGQMLLSVSAEDTAVSMADWGPGPDAATTDQVAFHMSSFATTDWYAAEGGSIGSEPLCPVEEFESVSLQDASGDAASNIYLDSDDNSYSNSDRKGKGKDRHALYGDRKKKHKQSSKFKTPVVDGRSGYGRAKDASLQQWFLGNGGNASGMRK